MKLHALFALAFLAGCSGTIHHRGVEDDAAARGLRYFDVGTYDLQVFRLSEQGGVEYYEPLAPPQAVSLAETSSLLEVNYEGRVFGSVTFEVALNPDGTLKTAKLENTGDPSAGLDAADDVVRTLADYEKTKEKREIEELQREIDLIEKRRKLEELRNPTTPGTP